MSISLFCHALLLSSCSRLVSSAFLSHPSTSASIIEWSMCGEVACFVPTSCMKESAPRMDIGLQADLSLESMDFDAIEDFESMNEKSCPVGILVKPYSAHKWFVSVRTSNKNFGILSNGRMVLSCDQPSNGTEMIGEDKLEKEIMNTNHTLHIFEEMTFHCNMIIKKSDKEIAQFLADTLSPYSFLISGDKNYSISTAAFLSEITKKITCDPDRLQDLIPYIPKLQTRDVSTPTWDTLACFNNVKHPDEWKLYYVDDEGKAVLGQLSCNRKDDEETKYEYYENMAKKWLVAPQITVFCAREACKHCSPLVSPISSPLFQSPIIAELAGIPCPFLYCHSDSIRIDGGNATKSVLTECFSKEDGTFGWSRDQGKTFINQMECVKEVNCQDTSPIALYGLESTPVRLWDSVIECPKGYTMRRSNGANQMKKAISRLECDSISGKWLEVQLNETIIFFNSSYLQCSKFVDYESPSGLIVGIVYTIVGLVAFFVLFSIFICCISLCCESILPDFIARIFRTIRIFIYRNLPCKCQTVEGYQEDVELNEMIPDSEMNFVGPLISRTYNDAEYQHRYADDSVKQKKVEKIKFNKDLNEVVDIGIGSQRGNEIFIDEKKSSKSTRSQKLARGSNDSEHDSLLHGYNVDVAEFMKEHEAAKKEFAAEDKAREEKNG